MRGSVTGRCWLLLARDAEPSMCLEDPGLDPGRYVYVEADTSALYPIARGSLGWTDAIAAGAIDVYGDPGLVRALPSWFPPVEAAPEGVSMPAAVA